MSQLTILDVYTTGGDGGRQTVFAPGDSIQFNTYFNLTTDSPNGSMLKVTWFVERYEQVILNGGDDFELLLIRKAFTYNFQITSAEATVMMNMPIPQPPPDTQNVNSASIQNLVLSDAWALLPGLWKLNTVMEFTETFAGHQFSVYGDWHYRILYADGSTG
jgi:hypothetical protein